MAQKEIEVILTRQLASYLAMPIIIIDSAGTLLFYNEPAEVILGMRFEETGELFADEWAQTLVVTDEQGTPLAPETRPLLIALTERRPTHCEMWLQGAGPRAPAYRDHRLSVDRPGRGSSGSSRNFLGGREMKVTLWGTRGSVATPGAETARYGGNTACVEVRGVDDTVLILDAGTGIRRLGMVLPSSLRRLDILLTHLHLDHLQGLGFFAPLHNPAVEVHIWGPASPTLSLEKRLMRYLSPPALSRAAAGVALPFVFT